MSISPMSNVQQQPSGQAPPWTDGTSGIANNKTVSNDSSKHTNLASMENVNSNGGVENGNITKHEVVTTCPKCSKTERDSARLLGEMENEIQEKNKRMQYHQSIADNYRTKCEKLSKEVLQKDTRIGDLISERDTFKKKCDEQMSKLYQKKDVSKANILCRFSLFQLLQSVTLLSKTRVDDNIDKIKIEMSHMTSKCEFLEKQNAEITTEKEALSKKKEKLEETIAQLETTNDQWNIKHNQTKKKKRAAIKQTEEIQEKLNTMKQTLQQTKAEMEQTNKNMKQLTEQLELEKENSNTKGQLAKDLQQQIQEKIAIINELTLHQQRQMEENRQLKMSIEQLKGQGTMTQAENIPNNETSNDKTTKRRGRPKKIATAAKATPRATKKKKTETEASSEENNEENGGDNINVTNLTEEAKEGAKNDKKNETTEVFPS
ncbi:massive surface protein MspF [Reticulomyxa filosa]|uniref:Massive surface protein MspF n=1 Tax=Reticulomyxa filosa TaxID=46433 RepID=X6N3L9_RETFI|nr:massive surface protein MspF [Reticulomyxa filosa]|eukprot:ETO19872.1 massive surface protein MspF [Reticulomyxa filosa]